ncbi:MAG: TRAP transporter fused permease subunit [Boseongicola sp.]|nr:TRAP transporter fused permease subunit [Boseongicola sp.]
MVEGRGLGALPKKGAYWLGLALAVLAFYTTGIGPFDPTIHRGIAVFVAVAAVLLSSPLHANIGGLSRYGTVLPWLVDLVLIGILAFSISRPIVLAEVLWTGIYDFTLTDRIAAILGSVVILEMTRRAIGLPLTLFGVLSIAYIAYGTELPWIFGHLGFSFDQIVQGLWFGSDGVFGLPVGIGLNIVFIYIVFGTILEGSGAATVLLKLAAFSTGWLRGGAAHSAVVASGLFGTMSGSAVANVVGTGVFTIPMIKKRGFSGTYAGAVETAASTGGQIMPPIMGATAFFLAELTGTPYLQVAIAALVPALLYYGSLFASIAIEARRLGLEPIPREERERMTREDWIRSTMFIVPIVVLILALLDGRSAAGAGFWAAVAATVMPFIVNPEIRANPARMLDAMSKGGIAGAQILMAAATIGILLAVFNMTGLGIRFSNIILTLGEGHLLLSLFFTMLGAIVLGMGLPSIAAYLIIVLIMGPALENLGIAMLVAHMFVFYFGVLSAITPPVALAAYAAAPIAGSRPLATGAVACRIALVAFFIPFVFAFHPSILLVLEFDPTDFVWTVIRSVIAIWMLVTALGRFERLRLPYWSVALRLLSAIGTFYPNLWLQLIAIGLAVALVAHEYFRARSVARVARLTSEA